MASIGKTRRSRNLRRPSIQGRSYASAFEPLPPAVRQRRAATWSKVAAALLLAGALVLGYDLLSHPHFRVEQVEVSGVELLSANMVAAEVDVAGQSLFTVQAAAQARRLAERFPAIAQATVRCTLPNRVTVQVREHPVALVWESGGRYWWIGEGGRVLGETNDPQGRTVLHDLKGLAPEPQDYVLGVPWDYAHAVAQALPQIREMDYALEEGLMASWGEARWPVLLGYEGDARFRAAVLQALEPQVTARHIAVDYVDLRNPERPIIKPR